MSATLILGGTGFIGRHLALNLAQQPDAEIVVADILPPNWETPPAVRFVECDVRRPLELGDFVPNLVVNLAAVHRTPGHPDHEYHETNESGADNVTNFCRTRDVRRLWFTSSIAVYGPGELPKDEESQLTPSSAYGRSKTRAEEIHRDWVEEDDRRRLVTVRPATIFGPGEGGNFTRLAKSLKTRTFLYPGQRTTRKACGYVDDLIGSLLYMEQFAKPSITYNFAYPEPPTTEEICDAFIRVAGYPRPLGTIPTPVLLAAARVLTAAGRANFDPQRVMKLVNSTNIVPRQLVERGYPYETDLQTALERWYREPPIGEFV